MEKAEGREVRCWELYLKNRNRKASGCHVSKVTLIEKITRGKSYNASWRLLKGIRSCRKKKKKQKKCVFFPLISLLFVVLNLTLLISLFFSNPSFLGLWLCFFSLRIYLPTSLSHYMIQSWELYYKFSISVFHSTCQI